MSVSFPVGRDIHSHSSVSSPVQTDIYSHIFVPYSVRESVQLHSFTSVSTQELAKLLQSSNGKTCDLDPVSAQIIKQHTQILGGIVHYRSCELLFNKSLADAILPDTFERNNRHSSFQVDLMVKNVKTTDQCPISPTCPNS